MPNILSTAPSAGTIDVPLNQVIEIGFDTPMDSSTINSLTILMAKGSTIVDGTVTYSESTKIAYYTPGKFLLPSTEYTIIIIGDFGGIGAGVRDIHGNGLASSYEFSFITAPELPETSGLYVAKVEYWMDTTGVYGLGTSCSPADGSFDSDYEQFYVNISSPTAMGSHTIYVHGQDSFGSWGAMQDAPFSVTSGEYQSSFTQTEYDPNYEGPFVFALTVTPTPTAGAPYISLIGAATTRTAYWEAPIIPIVERTGNLEVVSCHPEDYDTQVSSYTPIVLNFSDNF